MLNHYTKNIRLFNEDLRNTKKAIVALGCSFTYGSAAFDLDLIEKYKPRYKNGAYWSFEHLTENECKLMLEEYPSIQEVNKNDFNFGMMENNNSFLTRLHKKYLKGLYTPLNLGVNSSGIFSSIARLFTVPINWNSAEDIIIIFSPTAGNRLSVLNDDYIFGNEYCTLWPWETNVINPHIDAMQKGFGHSFYSEKWDILNILTSVKLLVDWVKFHNAKLITFPAFNRYYTPDYFNDTMRNKVIRNVKDRTLIEIIENHVTTPEEDFLLEYFPWESFIAPQGKSNFFDLAYSQEPGYDPKQTTVSMASELGGSPNKWIMNCGHPDAKSHNLLADEIYKHLELTDFCNKTWNIWK